MKISIKIKACFFIESVVDFVMSEAVYVINADLVNNIGNLLQRSMVKKLNPSQTYPTFYPDSFRNSLLELGEPLVRSINRLPGIVFGQIFSTTYGNYSSCQIHCL